MKDYSKLRISVQLADTLCLNSLQLISTAQRSLSALTLRVI